MTTPTTPMTADDVLAQVTAEMRARKVNHGKDTSPTLIAWADQIDTAASAVYAQRDALLRRVAELEDLMRQIERRTFAHQDDDNDDRKRNLYIANSHARAALARSKGGAS